MGARAKAAREAKDVTQEDLAADPTIDITAGYLSKIENAQKPPSAKLRKRLAAALGVTVEWLEQGDQEPPPAEHNPSEGTAEYDPYAARARVRERYRALYDEMSAEGRRRFDRRSSGSPSQWTEEQWKELLTTLNKADALGAFQELEDAPKYQRLVPKKSLDDD